MANTSVPTSPKEATPDYADYVLRGLGIFELHREEVLASYQGGGRWLIPSGSENGKHYEVRVGSRPERSRCECQGYASHKHCSHIVAGQRAARLSGVCDDCGERFWYTELVEVTEDHDSLTWFPGDLLCYAECAGNHGVL